MKKLLSFTIVASIAAVTTSCVSAGKYDKLEAEHKQTQTTLADLQNENKALETMVANLQKKLGKASTDQTALKKDIDEMKMAMKEMRDRKRKAEMRIAEYKRLVSKFRRFIDSGELTIKIVDGRMIVGLPSDVLFKSGSARLSKKGNETIKNVSRLLASIKDRKFQVEGHTDNVPIKTAQYSSNWELAAARAINVVGQMINEGMPQERVSAASFSDTRPEKENDSVDGRKVNRRIEIAIVPDLRVLPGYDELKKLDQDTDQKQQMTTASDSEV